MENVGFLIKKISDRLLSELNYNLKKYNITARQLEMLDYIKENGSMSQKELGDYFGIRHTTVIDLIKKLEEKNFVVKSKNEKYNIIALTDEGKKIAEEVGSFRDDIEEIIAKGLGKENKKVLIDSLDIIYQNICEYEIKQKEDKDDGVK